MVKSRTSSAVQGPYFFCSFIVDDKASGRGGSSPYNKSLSPSSVPPPAIVDTPAALHAWLEARTQRGIQFTVAEYRGKDESEAWLTIWHANGREEDVACQSEEMRWRFRPGLCLSIELPNTITIFLRPLPYISSFPCVEWKKKYPIISQQLNRLNSVIKAFDNLSSRTARIRVDFFKERVGTKVQLSFNARKNAWAIGTDAKCKLFPQSEGRPLLGEMINGVFNLNEDLSRDDHIIFRAALSWFSIINRANSLLAKRLRQILDLGTLVGTILDGDWDVSNPVLTSPDESLMMMNGCNKSAGELVMHGFIPHDLKVETWGTLLLPNNSLSRLLRRIGVSVIESLRPSEILVTDESALIYPVSEGRTMLQDLNTTAKAIVATNPDYAVLVSLTFCESTHFLGVAEGGPTATTPARLSSSPKDDQSESATLPSDEIISDRSELIEGILNVARCPVFAMYRMESRSSTFKKIIRSAICQVGDAVMVAERATPSPAMPPEKRKRLTTCISDRLDEAIRAVSNTGYKLASLMPSQKLKEQCLVEGPVAVHKETTSVKNVLLDLAAAPDSVDIAAFAKATRYNVDGAIDWLGKQACSNDISAHARVPGNLTSPLRDGDDSKAIEQFDSAAGDSDSPSLFGRIRNRRASPLSPPAHVGPRDASIEMAWNDEAVLSRRASSPQVTSVQSTPPAILEEVTPVEPPITTVDEFIFSTRDQGSAEGSSEKDFPLEVQDKIRSETGSLVSGQIRIVSDSTNLMTSEHMVDNDDKQRTGETAVSDAVQKDSPLELVSDEEGNVLSSPSPESNLYVTDDQSAAISQIAIEMDWSNTIVINDGLNDEKPDDLEPTQVQDDLLNCFESNFSSNGSETDTVTAIPPVDVPLMEELALQENQWSAPVAESTVDSRYVDVQDDQIVAQDSEAGRNSMEDEEETLQLPWDENATTGNQLEPAEKNKPDSVILRRQSLLATNEPAAAVSSGTASTCPAESIVETTAAGMICVEEHPKDAIDHSEIPSVSVADESAHSVNTTTEDLKNAVSAQDDAVRAGDDFEEKSPSLNGSVTMSEEILRANGGDETAASTDEAVDKAPPAPPMEDSFECDWGEIEDSETPIVDGEIKKACQLNDNTERIDDEINADPSELVKPLKIVPSSSKEDSANRCASQVQESKFIMEDEDDDIPLASFGSGKYRQSPREALTQQAEEEEEENKKTERMTSDDVVVEIESTPDLGGLEFAEIDRSPPDDGRLLLKRPSTDTEEPEINLLEAVLDWADASKSDTTPRRVRRRLVLREDNCNSEPLRAESRPAVSPDGISHKEESLFPDMETVEEERGRKMSELRPETIVSICPSSASPSSLELLESLFIPVRPWIILNVISP